jgi:hypothetical protein
MQLINYANPDLKRLHLHQMPLRLRYTSPLKFHAALHHLPPAFVSMCTARFSTKSGASEHRRFLIHIATLVVNLTSSPIEAARTKNAQRHRTTLLVNTVGLLSG